MQIVSNEKIFFHLAFQVDGLSKYIVAAQAIANRKISKSFWPTNKFTSPEAINKTH